jgi:hypothetical protein
MENETRLRLRIFASSLRFERICGIIGKWLVGGLIREEVFAGGCGKVLDDEDEFL